jgi:hypothetical protein
MTMVSRWLAPVVIAAGLGFGAMVPAPAQAQDDGMVRVLVNVADEVLQGGQPYYRYGNYGQYDRLLVRRDPYGRPAYYRVVPRRAYYGNYNGNYNGNYGYSNPYRHAPVTSRVQCSSAGNCTVKYYDPSYDRRGYQSRYDNRYDRRRHGHKGRGHGRDDD